MISNITTPRDSYIPSAHVCMRVCTHPCVPHKGACTLAFAYVYAHMCMCACVCECARTLCTCVCECALCIHMRACVCECARTLECGTLNQFLSCVWAATLSTFLQVSLRRLDLFCVPLLLYGHSALRTECACAHTQFLVCPFARTLSIRTLGFAHRVCVCAHSISCVSLART